MVSGENSNDQWVVKALYAYPVKSCGPVRLSEALVGETGLAYDRLWMLTDAKTGRFLTQRQEPKMTLINVSINRAEDKLELSTAAMPTTLRLPLHPQPGKGLGEQFTVRVWYDSVLGRSCGQEADDWLSEFLGKPIRLLYKDPAEPRLVSRYLPKEGSCEVPPQSGFADVHPFHITTDPSLDDVNKRVPRPLTHQNFRPNIVFSPVSPSAAPYDEETWKRIEFEPRSDSGAWSMLIASRTSRCTMPNVDIETGTMSADHEPQASMKTFRCTDPGKPTRICFGMQAVPQRIGQTIAVGQAVSVCERGLHSLAVSL
ncbi:hypothetical protein GQ54DRAFT_145844 [Martensiomyces pterosporus]|nr:hypothetical protein GQ54DRAFT_145844 [Martensiomyces pterosporus]